MNMNQFQQSQQIAENAQNQQNRPQTYQIKVIQSPLIKANNNKYENKLSLQNESSTTQLPKIESRSTCISQDSRQKQNQKASDSLKPDLNQILESQLQTQFYSRNNFLLKTAKSDNQNNNLIFDLTQTSLSFSQRCNSSNYDITTMRAHNNNHNHHHNNKHQLLKQNEINKININYLHNENVHIANFITTHSNLINNFDSKYAVDTHDNESIQQQIMSSTTSHFENHPYDSKNIRVTENKLSESQFHQIQSQFQSQNQQQFSKQKKIYKDKKNLQQTVNRIKKKFFGLQLNKLEKIQEKSSFLQNSNSRNIFKENNGLLNLNHISNKYCTDTNINNQDSEEQKLSIKSNSISPKNIYQLDNERPSLQLSFHKQEDEINTPIFKNKNHQQNEKNLFLMKKVKLRLNSNNNRFSRNNNNQNNQINNNNNLINEKNKSNLNLMHQNSNDNQVNNSISNNNSINNIIQNTNNNNNNHITGINKTKRLILTVKKNDNQANHHQQQNQQQTQQNAKQKIRKGITIAKNNNSNNNNHNQQQSTCYNQKQNINQIQLSIEDFPSVTANSWCVFNAQKQTYLFGKKALQQVEIASLTKIMTALVVCKFIQRMKLDIIKFYTQVSNNSVIAGGTTAQLQQGDIVNINDLLHGLMLPSGNDAAIVLAEYIGFILLLEDNQKVKQKNIPEIMIVPEFKQEEAIQKFLKEMNKVGVAAGMERSHFASVHGMMNRLNISTARDVAILTCAAQEDSLFNNLVKTQKFIGNIYKFQQQYLLQPVNLQQFSQLTKNKQEKVRADQFFEFNRQIEWNNTNKLLYMDSRFDGVKTGITDQAGACLCSSFKVKKPNGNFISIIIVILSSKSMEDRWEDSKLITKWSLKRYFNYNL